MQFVTLKYTMIVILAFLAAKRGPNDDDHGSGMLIPIEIKAI